MRINELTIRHLKSVDSIKLKFKPKKGIALIYGQNGVGKTTILEAVSLLGHLATMRRIEMDGAGKTNIQESFFLDLLRRGILHGEQVYRDALQGFCSIEGAFSQIRGHIEKSEGKTETLDKILFESELPKSFGAIIKCRIIPNASRPDRELEFYIYFRRVDPESPEKPEGEVDDENLLSITQALGRKTYDDLRMNNTFALIYRKGDDEDEINSVLKQLVHSCPFTVPDDGSKTGRSYLILKHTDHKEDTSLGYAFYLNTDLNDFGRMKDVRESVKDIQGDFVEEWVNRLGISFDVSLDEFNPDRLEFRKKDDLEKAMNEVLRPSAWYRVWDTSRRGVFKLSICEIDKGKIKLKVKREGHIEPLKVDYLSAGENECFFIFMYLLGMSIRNSICLLDEPDLHLTNSSKKPFYNSLYRLLRQNNCQVIVATHSGFAYTMPHRTQRFLIRRVKIWWGKKRGTWRFKEKYTWGFKIRQAVDYCRTALGVLGADTSIGMMIVFLSIISLIALVSDSWQYGFGQSFDRHREIINYTQVMVRLLAGMLIYLHCIRYVWLNITDSD